MSLLEELYTNFNEFHVGEITTNRFVAEDFHSLLLTLSKNYTVTELGKSVEGRPIYSLILGNGPIKLLAWSQMHGNESTATRAILDILSFFNKTYGHGREADTILEKLTICLVPILNPDGTNNFQRRNALEIDLNRDARAQEAPESKLLARLVKDFQPDYAFNLHDQRRFYNISNTAKPSTIAFLAPAYNKGEATNKSRGRAMKLIAHLRESLELVIPGQIGIYSDTYSSRAFGDFVQASGASTILVESGWQHDDMEKEFVRKLNFCLLISAFYSIANDNINKSTIDDYWNIPLNDERLFDVLIKDITVVNGNGQYNVDIGITRSEFSVDNTSYYSRGEISDIGDLEGWYGFQEVNASQLTLQPGKVWPEEFATSNELSQESVTNLVSEGYLFVHVKQNQKASFFEKPINIVKQNFSPDKPIVLEEMANFLLAEADGTLAYAVINGYLWKLDEPMPGQANGLIIK